MTTAVAPGLGVVILVTVALLGASCQSQRDDPMSDPDPATVVAPRAPMTLTTGTTASGLRHHVALPAGHSETSGPYPVLYHLHGATQSWSSLEDDVAALASLIDRESEAGRLPPIVVVAPHDPTGWSMWTDSHDGSNDIASAIASELLPHVERQHRVTDRASRRIVQGFSMGSFGAAAIGLHHPDVFSSIAILDGAMHDWSSLTRMRPHIASDQFGDDEAFFDGWSPWTQAVSTDPTAQRIVIVRAAMSDFHRRYLTHLDRAGFAPLSIATACPHDVACIAREAGTELAGFYGSALGS